MLYLKACPRCRGDIHYATDIDGPYLQCLQCGFNVTSGHCELVAASTQEEPVVQAGGWKRSTIRFTQIVFVTHAVGAP